MQRFPHHYTATASGAPTGTVATSSPDLPDLAVDGPPEFGGPGGAWSPETLMMAAVADCFVLTWRSVATVNRFDWTDLSVDAAGVLDRVERVTRFTEIHLTVRLTLPPGADQEQAEKLAHRAEAACLVTNSMTAPVTLQLEVLQG